MTAVRVLVLLMEDSDRPLVLVRPKDVCQRLLQCDVVTDGDLAELAISLVLTLSGPMSPLRQHWFFPL